MTVIALSAQEGHHILFSAVGWMILIG